MNTFPFVLLHIFYFFSFSQFSFSFPVTKKHRIDVDSERLKRILPDDSKDVAKKISQFRLTIFSSYLLLFSSASFFQQEEKSYKSTA